MGCSLINSTTRSRTLALGLGILTLTLLQLTFGTSASWAGEDKTLFNQARSFAKSSQPEFAFMRFCEIRNNFPRSSFLHQATFASAEYYFNIRQLKEATDLFNDFLTRSSDPKGKLFAMAYLYKIAELQKKKTLLRELESKIISFQQVSLVFRNHKDFTYISPMNNHLKAVYQINTIEFYRGGDLFAKISY